MHSTGSSAVLPSFSGNRVPASLREVLDWAARYYVQQLRNLGDEHSVRVYLNQRGFRTEVLERFQVGFAPDQWQALVEAGCARGFSAEVLGASGLAVCRRDGQGYFDRLRGRLIFPFVDPEGRVRGFAARTVDGLPASTGGLAVRYLNTPRTSCFRKQDLLYGAPQAQDAIRVSGTCVVVEGYTDVLALHQSGIEQAVAVGGSVVYPPQARYLAQLLTGHVRPGRVVLAFDADEAGRTGVKQALPLLLQRGLLPEVATLAPGQDVADVGRQERRKGLLRLMRRRCSFTAFLLARAREEGRLDEPASYAEAIREMLALIQCLPERAQQVGFLTRAFAESRYYGPRFVSDHAQGEAARLAAWCAVFTEMAQDPRPGGVAPREG